MGMGGVHLPGPAGFQPYLLTQPPQFCGAQSKPGQLHLHAPRLHDYAADLRRADRCCCSLLGAYFWLGTWLPYRSWSCGQSTYKAADEGLDRTT